jgi:long-chain acyl-CoA synthetase
VWLDAYPPGVPATYEYPLVPFSRFLDDAAQDFPHSPAIHYMGSSLTYRELLDHVDRFATALRNLGVRAGDRVGVALPTCPQHVITIFAALRLGATVAETSPTQGEARLAGQLNDADCKVLVVHDPVYRAIRGQKGRLRGVEHVVATALADSLPFHRRQLFGLRHRNDPDVHYRIPPDEGVLRFSELVERTAPAVVQAEIRPRDDVALLLYTAGSTGSGRAVMVSHFNLVANTFQVRLWMPDVQAGRENLLCAMPLHQAFGVTACLGVGVLSAATLTLLPRFDATTALKTIDNQRPTLFPGVPAVFEAITTAPDAGKHDLSSIRACLSSAAPLPPEVAKRFEELTGGKLRESYGLTEASPVTHANPIYGRAKRGSIGLPVTDTACILVDLADPARQAAPRAPGELAIAGPQVTQGYWRRPDDTAEALRDGWLLTGDVAVIDEEGFCTIVDRKQGAAR